MSTQQEASADANAAGDTSSQASGMTAKQRRAYASVKRRAQEFKAKRLEELGDKPIPVINAGQGRGLHISGHRGTISCQPPVAFSRWLLTHPEISPFVKRAIVQPGDSTTLENGAPRKCILDVAGGKGQLAQTLQFLYRIETVVLDPRPVDCRKQLRHHLCSTSLPPGFEIVANEFDAFFEKPPTPREPVEFPTEELLEPSPMLVSFRRKYEREVYNVTMGPRTRLRLVQKLWRNHLVAGYKRLDALSEPPAHIEDKAQDVLEIESCSQHEHQSVSSSSLFIDEPLVQSKQSHKWLWLEEFASASTADDNPPQLGTKSKSPRSTTSSTENQSHSEVGAASAPAPKTLCLSMPASSENENQAEGKCSRVADLPNRQSQQGDATPSRETGSDIESKAEGPRRLQYVHELQTDKWYKIDWSIPIGQDVTRVEEWYNSTWRKHDETCWLQQLFQPAILSAMGQYWDEKARRSEDGEAISSSEHLGPIIQRKRVVCLLPDYRKWSADAQAANQDEATEQSANGE